MGKDRQEKKLREKKVVESDRDQSISNKGSAALEGADEARERNK